MVFNFLCPGCGAVLSAQKDMAGASVRCPGCSSVLKVPSAETAASGQGDAVAEEAPVDFGGGRKIPEDDMDMTPMVDVTFLLLIFFMVTAAFSMQKSFEVPAPENSEPSSQATSMEDLEDDPESIVVRVDALNTFRVITPDWDKEAAIEQELLVQLREAKRGGSAGVIPNTMLVVANGEALHETVVMALDAGTTVGLEEIQLMTVEEDD